MSRRPEAFGLLLVACFAFEEPATANTYGAVEPIANPAVIDTRPLHQQSLALREAFARRLYQCGIVQHVVDALTTQQAIGTINSLNTHFEVTAGGFAGHTNPTYAYTIIDSGPNAASMFDIKVLTNSLGYVFSQESTFLLDTDNASSFEKPANYLVLNFAKVPTLDDSAALFEAVGRVDPKYFTTDEAGYTQFARAFLTLQPSTPKAHFIESYARAAARAGLEYAPIIHGVPSVFVGSAAFFGNDWTKNPDGRAYLTRIPSHAHRVLAELRTIHLETTRRVLRQIPRTEEATLLRAIRNLPCL